MRMTTSRETLVDHGTEKERNLHLTGDGEVKSVVVVTTKEMIEDFGILEVEGQEGHLDPQAVGRTTMVAEMKIEEETQKRTDAHHRLYLVEEHNLYQFLFHCKVL